MFVSTGFIFLFHVCSILLLEGAGVFGVLTLSLGLPSAGDGAFEVANHDPAEFFGLLLHVMSAVFDLEELRLARGKVLVLLDQDLGAVFALHEVPVTVGNRNREVDTVTAKELFVPHWLALLHAWEPCQGHSDCFAGARHREHAVKVLLSELDELTRVAAVEESVLEDFVSTS